VLNYIYHFFSKKTS